MPRSNGHAYDVPFLIAALHENLHFDNPVHNLHVCKAWISIYTLLN